MFPLPKNPGQKSDQKLKKVQNHRSKNPFLIVRLHRNTCTCLSRQQDRLYSGLCFCPRTFSRLHWNQSNTVEAATSRWVLLHGPSRRKFDGRHQKSSFPIVLLFSFVCVCVFLFVFVFWFFSCSNFVFCFFVSVFFGVLNEFGIIWIQKNGFPGIMVENSSQNIAKHSKCTGNSNISYIRFFPSFL